VSLSCYVGGTIGFDGLLVITRKAECAFNQASESGNGIGDRRPSRSCGGFGVPWERCDVVWGNTTKHLPFTCVSGGSQTTHAMTRAAMRCHGCDTETPGDRRDDSGRQTEDYIVANERVVRKGSGSGLTLAQAAQRAIELGGEYDGHEAPPTSTK